MRGSTIHRFLSGSVDWGLLEARGWVLCPFAPWGWLVGVAGLRKQAEWRLRALAGLAGFPCQCITLSFYHFLQQQQKLTKGIWEVGKPLQSPGFLWDGCQPTLRPGCAGATRRRSLSGDAGPLSSEHCQSV